MQGFCNKFCTHLMGDRFMAYLESSNQHLDGNLGLRFYPSTGNGQLGAHLDANLFTVLWANGPGLQVPSVEAGLTADDVRAIGLPSFCPAPPLPDDKWADVGSFWKDDMLLVTIGEGWFHDDSPTMSMFPGVLCPVLHRVSAGTQVNREHRFSIPYQVRILPKGEH
jgi:isopenicillin N synthase-like dioxygenase